MSVALLLAELEAAADADTEAGERAIESVRERIGKLTAIARMQLATTVRTKLAETDVLRATAMADRVRAAANLRDWLDRTERLPGIDERIAECQVVLRDTDAVVYEYDELYRVLTRLTALLAAERD